MLRFYNCSWTPNSHGFVILLQILQIFAHRISCVFNSPFTWRRVPLLVSASLSGSPKSVWLARWKQKSPGPVPSAHPEAQNLLIASSLFPSFLSISGLSTHHSDRIIDMVSLTFDPGAYSRTWFCFHSLPSSFLHDCLLGKLKWR